ncbi:hypothetical protein [Paenibacillus odorifer]|uniref:hypothetical protein n=1 Tax=Paenibacillus odorifer TaxID=189426 RepID=UPI0021161321|nr:hypothetical protein [Paenibacillus odorifer]
MPSGFPGAIYIEGETGVEPTTIVAMIAAVSGVVLGWTGKTQAFKKDVAQEAGNGASLRTDVEYIKRGVDDMRLEQRAQGQRFDLLSERVTRIEEASKSYHKRLDRFEENRRGDL